MKTFFYYYISILRRLQEKNTAILILILTATESRKNHLCESRIRKPFQFSARQLAIGVNKESKPFKSNIDRQVSQVNSPLNAQDFIGKSEPITQAQFQLTLKILGLKRQKHPLFDVSVG